MLRLAFFSTPVKLNALFPLGYSGRVVSMLMNSSFPFGYNEEEGEGKKFARKKKKKKNSFHT